MKKANIILFFVISLISFNLSARAVEFRLQKLVSNIKSDLDQIWSVSQGKMAWNDLSSVIKNYQWNGENLVSITPNSIKEISFNFGATPEGLFVIENLSVGGPNQSPLHFSHDKIRRWEGHYHNHPYKYESVKDNAFSSIDVIGAFSRISYVDEGFIWFIETADYYFALVVEDVFKVKNRFNDLQQKANEKGLSVNDFATKVYHSAKVGSGSVFDITTNGGLAITGKAQDSGLGYYFSAKKNVEFKKLN